MNAQNYSESQYCSLYENETFETFPTLPINIPPITRTYQNKYFEITSDLSLGSDNFIFTNCIFKVSPGKKISVGSATTSFTNCKFYSYDGGWQGLFVNYFSTVNLSTCFFEFAQTAVSASGNSNLAIIGSTFYHNSLGVRIANNVNLTRYTNNTIRGYPKYSTVEGYSVRYNGNEGLGMVIDNNRRLINISSGSLSFNKFIQLESGLTIINSNVNIARTTFVDMFTNRPNLHGFGINIQSTTRIDVTVNGYGTNPTFKNCETFGVNSTGDVNLTVENCKMIRDIEDLSDRPTGSVMSDGIKVGPNSFCRLNIVNNYFRWNDNRTSYKTNAMVALYTSNNTVVRVNDNEFIDETPTYTGLHTCVLLSQVQHTTANQIQVNLNTIEKNLCFGIILFGCKLTSANNNIITNHQASKDQNVPVKAFIGIHSHGGDFNTINSNTISDQLALRDNEQFFHRGIAVTASGNNLICSNDLSNMEGGLYFEGICIGPGALVGQNLMTDHRFCLFYADDAMHRPQHHTGNVWEGTFDDFAAQYLGDNAQMNEYLICEDPINEVCDGYDPNLGNWPPSINQSGDWINDNISGRLGCFSYGSPPWVLVIKDTTIWDHSGDGVIWTLHRNFISDYLTDTLMQNDADCIQFFDSVSLNGSLDFEDLYRSIRFSQQYLGSALEEYLEYSYQMILLGHSILDLDSLIQVAEGEEPTQELLDSMSLLIEHYSLYFDTVQLLHESEMERIGTLRDSLYDQIVLLDPNSIVQSRDSALMHIELNHYYGDTLTEEELDFCTEMALECYNDFGFLVHRAYHLLPQYVQNELEDYPGLCQEEIVSETSGKLIEQNSFHVYPNPANEFVVIESISKTIKKIKIFDFYGRLIHTENPSSMGNYYLKTTNLIPGFYFIEVEDGTNMSSNHRFIIQR